MTDAPNTPAEGAQATPVNVENAENVNVTPAETNPDQIETPPQDAPDADQDAPLSQTDDSKDGPNS